MDSDAVGAFIPIAAIVFWGVSSIVKRYLQHKEWMASQLGTTQGSVNHDIVEELRALKAEIDRLRDTTTQYDLSIDHHLRDLDQRLESVEKRPAVYTPPPGQAQEEQALFRGQ